MSEYTQAELFFLTEPDNGVYVINMEIEHKFLRIQINDDQLKNLISDGARMKFQTGGR